MRLSQLTEVILVTVALGIGLSAADWFSYRGRVMDRWSELRCEPGVAASAAIYKPANDPRTPEQFARDNWSFCQKRYVQDGIRAAAAIPAELAAGTKEITDSAEGLVGSLGDLFYDLWKFIYEAYSGFMDQMKGAAKLFQNFMIQLHSIVGRLQAAAVSIAYGLISTIVALVNSVRVTLIVAIIIVGILTALQIILFFVLLPIEGLIITVSAVVSVAVVVISTAIAAAMVTEMFAPGVCFARGTSVMLEGGATKPIETVRVGDALGAGARVTAVHQFWSAAPLYDLAGVHVTGDHLVTHPDVPSTLIPVRNHPAARLVPNGLLDAFGVRRELWCLTTTTRRIPVRGAGGAVLFADWEEIPDGDQEQLRAWYREVWGTLNGRLPPMRVGSRVLDAEGGLSPDCWIPVSTWWGTTRRRAVDVRVGDKVLDANGRPTEVVGRVVLAGDQSTDAVELPDASGDGVQVVSVATWVRRADGVWAPAIAFRGREIHPAQWIHLYTEAGTFRVGDWVVRDASEVGLDRLRPIVESVILDHQTEAGDENRGTI